MKQIPKQKELFVLKSFLSSWLKSSYCQVNFGGKILVHISANMKLIEAPSASAGKSKAQIDGDEGSSLGNHYEIVIWKAGDLG